MKRILALVLSVILVLALFAGCSSQKKEAVKVRIGTQELPHAEAIAKQLGYFKEAFEKLGYELEISSFSSGPKLNTALMSGDIDFAMYGSCPAANGISSGADVKVIALQVVLGGSEYLAAKNGSGIESVKDLVGKTVATPFASTAHYSLLKAMQVEGVAETDVDLIDMQPAEINAAWFNGQIDATYCWEPLLSELLSEGKEIINSGEVAAMGYMTCDVSVVRRAFAEEHPDAVKAYVECTEKGLQLYSTNRAEAVKAIAENLNISEEDAEKQAGGNIWLTAAEQYEQYFSNGMMAKTLYETASFLYEQGSISNLPSLEDFEKAVDTETIKAVAGK